MVGMELQDGLHLCRPRLAVATPVGLEAGFVGALHLAGGVLDAEFAQEPVRDFDRETELDVLNVDVGWTERRNADDLPSLLYMGPPLLPLLIAASVWIELTPELSVRRALTIPVVIVGSRVVFLSSNTSSMPMSG